MSDRSNAPPMQRRGGPRPTETRMLRPPRPIDNRTGATQVENSPKTGKTHTNETGSCSKDTNTGVNTPSFARGGKVKRTGKIKAHKGEVVLPIKLVQKLKKLMV